MKVFGEFFKIPILPFLAGKLFTTTAVGCIKICILIVNLIVEFSVTYGKLCTGRPIYVKL